MILRPGDEPIPRYRLVRFLGQGQFGQVWEAAAPGNASIALKFLDLSGKQGRKEFRAIQRMKRIRHANLMPIIGLWLLDSSGNVLDNEALDTISDESTVITDTLALDDLRKSSDPACVLVFGQPLGRCTLGDRLRECQAEGHTGIPFDELIVYMDEAARVIDFLNTCQHDLGDGPVAVRHCDIKPTNILLVGNSVSITDYGLAQVLASTDSARATGMVGSPAYMSPECMGREPSSASDQYSLAVSYVELRTGKLPFRSEILTEVLDAHREGRLELSALSPAEQKVIRRATSRDPAKRYPSAWAMVQALRDAVLPPRVPHRPHRWRQTAILLAAAAAGLAGLATFIVTLPDPVAVQTKLGSELEAMENKLTAPQTPDPALVKQNLTGIQETLQSLRGASPELRVRTALGIARAQARISPEDTTTLRALLMEVETTINAFQGNATTPLWPDPKQEATYLVLQTLSLPVPDSLSPLFELYVRSESESQRLDQWVRSHVDPWEAQQFVIGLEKLEAEVNRQVTQLLGDPGSADKVNRIWPDMASLSQLGQVRDALSSESGTDVDVIANLQKLTLYLRDSSAMISRSDASLRLLRSTCGALEQRLGRGVSHSDLPLAIENLANQLRVVADQSASQSVAAELIDASRAAAIRLALFHYLYSANPDKLTDALMRWKQLDGRPPDPSVLIAAAQLDAWLRAQPFSTTSTIAVEPEAPASGDTFAPEQLVKLKELLRKTTSDAEQQSNLVCNAYGRSVAAAVGLWLYPNSIAERIEALEFLSVASAQALPLPVLESSDFQPLLVAGLLRHAESLYRQSLFPIDVDSAAEPRKTLVALVRQIGSSSTRLPQAVASEANQRHWEVRLAAVQFAGQLVDGADIASSATEVELEALLDLAHTVALAAKNPRIDSVSLYQQLVDKVEDQAQALLAQDASPRHKQLAARAAYQRGRLLKRWISDLRPIVLGQGQKIDDEISTSFRYAFEQEPTNEEYLHQLCRVIAESEPTSPQQGVNPERLRLAALDEVLNRFPNSSRIAEGWRGYVEIMRARLRDGSTTERLKKAIDKLSTAIASVDNERQANQQLPEETRAQVVTFLLNRSTALVELGFESPVQERRRLYDQAAEDAKTVIEAYGESDNPKAYVAWGNAWEDIAYYVGDRTMFDPAVKKFKEGITADQLAFSDYCYPPAAYGFARCKLRQVQFLYSKSRQISDTDALRQLSEPLATLDRVLALRAVEPAHRAETLCWKGHLLAFQAKLPCNQAARGNDLTASATAFRDAAQLFQTIGNFDRQLEGLIEAWDMVNMLGTTHSGQQHKAEIQNTIEQIVAEKTLDELRLLGIADKQLMNAVIILILSTDSASDETNQALKRDLYTRFEPLLRQADQRDLHALKYEFILWSEVPARSLQKDVQADADAASKKCNSFLVQTQSVDSEDVAQRAYLQIQILTSKGEWDFARYRLATTDNTALRSQIAKERAWGYRQILGLIDRNPNVIENFAAPDARVEGYRMFLLEAVYDLLECGVTPDAKLVEATLAAHQEISDDARNIPQVKLVYERLKSLSSQ